VRYLSYKWGIRPERIAVAGDSGNDEEMLRGPFRGIVVGNHAPELEGLRGRRGVYFAEGALARGVLEGLRHWRFVRAPNDRAVSVLALRSRPRERARARRPERRRALSRPRRPAAPSPPCGRHDGARVSAPRTSLEDGVGADPRPDADPRAA
jgi:hypothetical protein